MENKTKVYVITSGCVYEGGSVENVFVSKELAYEYFHKLVEEQRSRNIELHDRNLNSDYTYEAAETYVGEFVGASPVTRADRAERWLNEEHELTEHAECYIFGKMDYIAIKEWDAQ